MYHPTTWHQLVLSLQADKSVEAELFNLQETFIYETTCTKQKRHTELVLRIRFTYIHPPCIGDFSWLYFDILG